MKRIYIFFIFLFVVLNAFAEVGLGKWNIYMSYYNSDMVEQVGNIVYVVAEGSLFVYNTEDTSIRTFDKQTGLSDNDIALMKYNPTTRSLLLIYSNGNIDIMSDGGVNNIPFLMTSTAVTDKTVNKITIHNEFAYVSTGFGVLVINMERKEIKETYNFSLMTTSCFVNNNDIYISTYDRGVLRANTTSNLLDINNWTNYSVVSPADTVSNIFMFDNRLCFFIKGNSNSKGIYYVNGNSLTPITENRSITSVKVVNNKLAAITAQQLFIYSGISNPDIINIAVNDIVSVRDNSFWIVEGTNGLREIQKTASGYATATAPIKIDGPRINSPYKIYCVGSKVYVVAGGKSSANGVEFNNHGIVMMYDYNRWTYIDREPVYSKLNIWPRDYLSLAIDPKNHDNIFVSSFGDGVIQFNGEEPVAHHNYNNSTIESAIAGNMRYMRIDGLSFDKSGNLWMTNSGVRNAVKVLDADGKWHSIYVESLSEQHTINDIFITSSNRKWINIPRVSPGIAILDDNNTIDDTSDDRSIFYSSFIDLDGNTFNPNSYTSITEDRNGYVWLGTLNGPVYFSSPDRAFDNASFRCTRIKIKIDEDSNEYGYFLENTKVTSICVDGGNRKWIGTEGNGVYLLNANNDEVIHHFDTSNSPLLSDNIYSIAINHETGDVFIGTDKGLVSYRSEATEGRSDFSDVSVYPNPVRPEFDGSVTINGLMSNSNVKITDLSGNLIYQTTSVGGQATWNCRNRSGNRVATGIYLVMGASEDGSEGVVAKIAVVK